MSSGIFFVELSRERVSMLEFIACLMLLVRLAIAKSIEFLSVMVGFVVEVRSASVLVYFFQLMSLLVTGGKEVSGVHGSQEGSVCGRMIVRLSCEFE